MQAYRNTPDQELRIKDNRITQQNTQKGIYSMKKGIIGVQMMMLKEEIAKHGIYEVMKQLTELGYHTVEVSQIPMTEENIRQLKKAQQELHIQVAAMSCGLEDISPEFKYPGDTLKNDFHKIVQDCRAVTCSILRIGMLPMSYASSPERMLEMTNILESYALRLKEYGIDLYYHAHTMEFYRWQGKPILTHMRERTQHLGFELDSHWMWRGGVDPVSYLESFKGRIRLLHLKDYRIGLVSDPSIMTPQFDIFGYLEQFAEVGEGVLDMPAIINAGAASGSEYFLIEQDRTYNRDVYESLRISRDNLIRMGYEDWIL